jgi:excisionase family DNA binding protein
MSRNLAVLISDPERLEDVPSDALPELLGELETLKARLWTRLQAVGGLQGVPAAQRSGNGADRLLTVQEVAERLSVTERWVYRKAGSLPFTRKLGTGTLRFSERGLERWKEARR